MEMVRTLFCKYDGRPHRLLESIKLGEDEHGLWVGSVPGSRGQRADGSWVSIDHHRVRLYPRGEWWSALFNDAPHPTEVYCDITMPAEFGVDSVTTVDLDLDIRRYRDGRVEVMDEDEFESHQQVYAYPPQVIAAARASCAWVVDNISSSEPFTTVYKTYLTQLRALTPPASSS
jgi:protein associated with RNAse G/E